MLYRIVTSAKIPSTFLTYQSDTALQRGQVVEVHLRKKLTTGIVIEELTSTEYDAKTIDKVIPVILPESYLTFLSLFCFNTLNDYNNTVSIICAWIDKLSQKQIVQLEKSFDRETRLQTIPHQKKSKKLDYSLDKDAWFRIRVIIRRLVEEQKELDTSSKTVLIIMPEIIYINQLKNNFKEFESEVSLHTFKGDSSATARLTFMELLENTFSTPTPTLNILLTTRTGIFLPFHKLDEIILVDEANHMYIQEQNKVYYDTRDAVFLMSENYSANLHFLSTLPSVRLYNFNSQKVLSDLQDYSKNYTQKLPKVQLYKRERKDTFQGIFSNEILEQIGVEHLED